MYSSKNRNNFKTCYRTTTSRGTTYEEVSKD